MDLTINVIVTSGIGVLNISWDAVDGATSYTVTRSPGGVVYTGANTSYPDSFVSAPTEYCYIVTSDNGGESSSVCGIPLGA